MVQSKRKGFATGESHTDTSGDATLTKVVVDALCIRS